MDVRLTEEQRALAKAAREWLHEKFPPERIAAIADAPPAPDPALWRELATLGWIGLTAPEEAGGGGASVVEDALLAEECGRGLLPAPLLSSAVAVPLLAASDDTALLRAVAAGERSVAVAHVDAGSTVARGVTDLPVVTDVVVVVGGAELWTVETAGAVRVVPTVDGTRSLGDLDLGAASAVRLAGGERAAAAISAARLRGLALLAAECVGVGQRCVDLAVSYATQRTQFDRPIGSYQAIAFALADAHAQLDWARSLVYRASWAISVGDASADRAASAAKVAASEAAVFAAERAIQTFAGIGMTWDHPVHRWYKRALAALVRHGSADDHRDRIAAALLDGVKQA